MQVVPSASEMSKISEEARLNGKGVTFVPTMGALHEGHLALIREGRKRDNFLVVSLFVNPRQFNNREDFEKYPRHLSGDLKKCEQEGVDVVFTPDEDEIYPPGETIPDIPLPKVALPLEGRSRPGHFKGVVTVVARLFEIVRPHTAIFGMKDYQQLRVIQEMVREQKIPVEISPHPTVRTKEGLALSSRNERLSLNGKRHALAIPRALEACQEGFLRGEREARTLENILQKKLGPNPGVKIDYAVVVDGESLLEIRTIVRPALAAVAVRVEGVRLIDNCLLLDHAKIT